MVNISGGASLSLTDVTRVARLICNSVEEDANVIFGALIDENLEDSISITVLATGFADNTKENLELLEEDVTEGKISKDAVTAARRGVGSMSRQPQQPVYAADAGYADDGGEEEPPSDNDKGVPSFLRSLKMK